MNYIVSFTSIVRSEKQTAWMGEITVIVTVATNKRIEMLVGGALSLELLKGGESEQLQSHRGHTAWATEQNT